MNCDHLDRWLFDWAEDADRLEPSIRAQLDQHLEHCPHCSRRVRQWRRLVAHLSSEPRPEPSPLLVDRVLATALSSRTDQPPRREKAPFFTEERIHVITSLVAAMVVMLLGQTLPDLPLETTNNVFGIYSHYVDTVFSAVMHWSELVVNSFAQS